MLIEADTVAPDAKGTIQYDASQVVVFGGKARRMLESASEFTIDSPELYALAAEDLQQVKALAKQVEETRVSITGPLDKAKKAVDALFRGPKDFLEQAESTLKSRMLTWVNEQERIRLDAERRAEAARRAEQERLDAIRRQQEEEARQRDEAARKAEAEARAAAEKGDVEAAAAAQQRAQDESIAAQEAAAQAHATAQTAEVISMPVAAPAVARVAGISTSKTIDFEVSSLHELIKHVAEHPELINLIAADSVKLRAYVRGLGMNCQLPGVRVFEKKNLAARAA